MLILAAILAFLGVVILAHAAGVMRACNYSYDSARNLAIAIGASGLIFLAAGFTCFLIWCF